MQKTSRFVAGAMIAMTFMLPLASSAQTLKHRVLTRTRGTSTLVHARAQGQAKSHKKGNGNVIKSESTDLTSWAHRTSFMGLVTAVSGNSISVKLNEATADYVVDVSGATVTKGRGKAATTVTASDIVVGDRLSIKGALADTTITATAVRDMGPVGPVPLSQRTSFMGLVTAVSGNTVSVNLNNNKSMNYPVDVSGATITKGRGKAAATAMATDISVGDRLTIAGKMVDSSITATAVRDLGKLVKSTGKGHKGSR